jgi:hypothetical protein
MLFALERLVCLPHLRHEASAVAFVRDCSYPAGLRSAGFFVLPSKVRVRRARPMKGIGGAHWRQDWL